MHAIDNSEDRIVELEAPLFASSWLALFRLIRSNAGVAGGGPATRQHRDAELAASDS